MCSDVLGVGAPHLIEMRGGADVSGCSGLVSFIYMHSLHCLIKRWCITIRTSASGGGVWKRISTKDRMTLRQLSGFPVARFGEVLLPIICALTSVKMAKHRGKDAGRRHRAGGEQNKSPAH